MPALPVLELTFHNVAGDPWEGEAIARFNGEPGDPFPVREGLTTQQRQDLRWYIEEFLDFPEGGYLTRARRIEREMDEYGHALWKGLQGPGVQSWLGAVQATRSGRLELRAATKEDETAFRSPWELLRAGDRLLHQHRVTVVRRPVSKTPKLHAADTSQGLRVLVVVCRPDEAGFLDPRYTPQAILEALASRPEVRVDFCRPGTLDALRQRLQTAEDAGDPFHVVHFDGHGDTGMLCFEKKNGRLDRVKAESLGELLAKFRIRLAALEACRTSTPGASQETLAGELLRRGVASVIAMGYAVHIDMTQRLMAAFYEALAGGETVGAALEAARSRVHAAPGRRLSTVPESTTEDLQDWFVPQLYQAEDDPILIPRSPTVSHKRASTSDLQGFPPPPRAGFEGRGYQLHRLERVLLHYPVVVLAGPGGMGKTALAREAAHWWTRTGWFEAAIFVSFEGRPSAQKVVHEVGLALEGTDFYKQAEPAGWVAEHLAQHRLLLVWDNFESVLPAFQNGKPMPPELAELAERWTKGETRILVTSRAAEVPLPGAHPVNLWSLSEPEALGLLARLLDKLGKGRTERAELGWDAETLQPLIAAAGGHPLALELLSPYLEQFSPEEVAADLGPLLAKAEQEQEEGRNRSLWASLEFSIRHLSAQAREALPAVALMAGGCMDAMARDVAGLDDAAWRQVRGELERTGMVRRSGTVLRPHPVLAEVEALAPTSEVEVRFFAVVQQLCGEFDQVVRSSDPKPALATMAVAEVVARRTVDRALAAGRVDVAGSVAGSLMMFLERTGRASEGARLVREVHERAGGDGEGKPTRVQARLAIEAAWARAGQDPAGAVVGLGRLLASLETAESWDPRHERAQALRTLGRVHFSFLGHPADALKPLEEAESLFRELEKDGYHTGNRSVVLGDRAIALGELARYDEALIVAEEGLALDRDRSDTAAVARTLSQIGQILMTAGRLKEAETRCTEALETAGEGGDDGLVGTLYQQLGGLADDRGRYDKAEAHYRRALEAFDQAGNDQGRMLTVNLLGVTESKRGNLREAQTWYEQSRLLAEELGDLAGQVASRSNLAFLYLLRAQQTKDPDEARRWLHRAIAEDRKVLEIKKTLGQPSLIAASHSNLAGYLLHAGQFEEAEEQAKEALAIREKIGDPELWKTLGILELVSKARGDKTATADWRRRKEAALADARERAGQAGASLQGVARLLQLAHAARAKGDSFAEALGRVRAPDDLLAQIRERDPWLLTHLQALAGGETRPEAKVPALYSEVVDAAWETVGRG